MTLPVLRNLETRERVSPAGPRGFGLTGQAAICPPPDSITCPPICAERLFVKLLKSYGHKVGLGGSREARRQ